MQIKSIIIMLISLTLILVHCFFFLICPADIAVRLVQSWVHFDKFCLLRDYIFGQFAEIGNKIKFYQ